MTDVQQGIGPIKKEVQGGLAQSYGHKKRSQTTPFFYGTNRSAAKILIVQCLCGDAQN